jgi:hypothetical protein
MIKFNQIRVQTRVLRAACVLALGALALMSWSLFDPRPIPVVLAMSLGQLLGTLSLGAFVVVVVADIRAGRATAAAEE